MGVMLARVRRVLITAAVILVFLVLAGATYQGATTVSSDRNDQIRTAARPIRVAR